MPSCLRPIISNSDVRGLVFKYLVLGHIGLISRLRLASLRSFWTQIGTYKNAQSSVHPFTQATPLYSYTVCMYASFLGKDLAHPTYPQAAYLLNRGLWQKKREITEIGSRNVCVVPSIANVGTASLSLSDKNNKSEKGSRGTQLTTKLENLCSRKLFNLHMPATAKMTSSDTTSPKNRSKLDEDRADPNDDKQLAQFARQSMQLSDLEGTASFDPERTPDSPKRNAAEVLESSLASLNLATGGNPGISPTSPPPGVNDSKRKLGKDFMKVIESQGSNISQLSLLVNDSASGKPFDEVYDIHEVLGEGGFAFVYRCTHKNNGNEYAVKEVLTTDYESAGENLRGEVNALKLLRDGPYVVRLLDVYYERERTMMVQEIMRGGDLLDKLTEIEVYEPRHARKVTRTLIEAIAYCHKKQICHRDIKPENVLLVRDDDLTHIKLADFGCAKKITGPKCLKTLCGR